MLAEKQDLQEMGTVQTHNFFLNVQMLKTFETSRFPFLYFTG